MVVAATQGAACFGAAYEFVFNVAYHLRKHKLKVPLAYVSAEPFPGHFGIGGLPSGEKLLGMFFKRQKIDGIFDVAIKEVAPGEIHLADGRTLPFKYAMVVPPFVGAEVVKRSGLGNDRGFIEVKDTYQTHSHANVYAVGIATAVNAPWQSANAVGVPKTGFPAETWRASRPTTSRPRSAARSRAKRRTSPASRPSASWTPATTASSSWPTTCCPRENTA
ncbi:MAG: hypothetical protein ACXVHB_19090 [Solirubrobacteraceae bacterium]